METRITELSSVEKLCACIEYRDWDNKSNENITITPIKFSDIKESDIGSIFYIKDIWDDYDRNKHEFLELIESDKKVLKFSNSGPVDKLAIYYKEEKKFYCNRHYNDVSYKCDLYKLELTKLGYSRYLKKLNIEAEEEYKEYQRRSVIKEVTVGEWEDLMSRLNRLEDLN